VASVTGIQATAIKEIADEILAAKSAAVYMSTGVNQSRQGLLSFWLVEMINFVTGNLGRNGGTYKPNGVVNYFPPDLGTLTLETSLGRLELPDPVGYALLPAALLPDLIENGDIHALITLGGNPLLSTGGEQRMRHACEKLEIMIGIDIYRNATGELSDYVLPATDWLERIDINLISSGMQTIPYVQYTDAMEAPKNGRRSTWWILARLAQAIEVSSPLNDHPEEKHGSVAINEVLAARGLSITRLKEMPRQTETLAQESRDVLYERCLQHMDKKIDCCPRSFAESGLFDRCHSIFAELQEEPADVLKLIGLRTSYMHNTWLSNTAKFRRGKQSINPLHISEGDAVARGLYDGDAVRVSTSYGSIETQVCIDNGLRPGAVAMSHGSGNRKSYGLTVASEKPGANCNALMPIGAGTYEPSSHMSWLSAVPVSVERV